MKRFYAVFAFIAAFVSLCLSCGDGGDIVLPGAGVVAGVVFESGTQNPIDSVTMVLKTEDYSIIGDTILTGTDGTYALVAGLSKGKHYVYASKAGYVETYKEVFVVWDDTATLNFELSKE